MITVGFLFGDTLAVAAPAHPDTNFAIIDSVVDPPNVASLVFAEEQGSFLVGAAAALKTKTGKIGFIGGVETDLIKKFEAGYMAGAKAVNPDIEIDVEVHQPAAGLHRLQRRRPRARRSRPQMYDGGADVVYTAAGGSGLGVFEAASEAGAPGDVWAIGVDSDQYLLATPDAAAVHPHLDAEAGRRRRVRDDRRPTPRASSAGGVQTFDLAAGGVGYATRGGFRRRHQAPSSTTSRRRSSAARSRCPTDTLIR